MNGDLQQFIKWASEQLQQPTLARAQIELVVCKPTSNQAAHLTVETDELIGRLTYWERGSAHAQVLPVDDDPATEDWNWDTVAPDNFGAAFRPFTSRFFQAEVMG